MLIIWVISSLDKTKIKEASDKTPGYCSQKYTCTQEELKDFETLLRILCTSFLLGVVKVILINI